MTLESNDTGKLVVNNAVGSTQVWRLASWPCDNVGFKNTYEMIDHTSVLDLMACLPSSYNHCAVVLRFAWLIIKKIMKRLGCWCLGGQTI